MSSIKVLIIVVCAVAFIVFCLSQFALTLAFSLWTLSGFTGLAVLVQSFVRLFEVRAAHKRDMALLDMARQGFFKQLE